MVSYCCCMPCMHVCTYACTLIHPTTISNSVVGRGKTVKLQLQQLRQQQQQMLMEKPGIKTCLHVAAAAAAAACLHSSWFFYSISLSPFCLQADGDLFLVCCGASSRRNENPTLLIARAGYTLLLLLPTRAREAIASHSC